MENGGRLVVGNDGQLGRFGNGNGKRRGRFGNGTATAGSVTATVGSVTATVTVTVGSVIGREARRVGPGGGWLEDRGREETDDYGLESKLAGRGVLMSC